MIDDEDVRYKKRDFIARANSVICNVKLTSREVCSRVFVAKCCHLYGDQAWSVNSKALTEFDVCWRKAVRKLWHLPYRARSSLLPVLVGTPSLRDQIINRFAKFYNGILHGNNNKMILLSNISTHSEQRKKGIMGENVKYISRLWQCTNEYLRNNIMRGVETETLDRVRAIKEITEQLENRDSLQMFDSSELSDLMRDIACY